MTTMDDYDIRPESFTEDDDIGMEPIPDEGDEEAEIKLDPSIEDDADDLGPQPTIIKSINGEENALTELITHPWMIQLLNKISDWAERKYKQEKEDIRQILLMKLLISICTINNPRRFKPWCYLAVKHHCLNEIRHTKVANSHLRSLKIQSQESTRQGGKPLIQSTAATSQEQELLKKEQKIILE